MSRSSQAVAHILLSVIISIVIGALSFVGCFAVFFYVEIKTHCMVVGPCGFSDGPNSNSWLNTGLCFLLFICPVTITALSYLSLRRFFSKRHLLEQENKDSTSVEI
jgi:Trk-type K+ transport system membrane component